MRPSLRPLIVGALNFRSERVAENGDPKKPAERSERREVASNVLISIAQTHGSRLFRKVAREDVEFLGVVFSHPFGVWLVRSESS